MEDAERLTDAEVARIAAGLTKAQRAYFLAHTGEEYFARHGVTANWALRHGYTDTLIHFADGRTMLWGDYPPDEWNDSFRAGGQVLTTLGLRVRAHIEGNPDHEA